MDIRIGFLHSRRQVSLVCQGNYCVYNAKNEFLGNIVTDEVQQFNLMNSQKAQFEWYEKIDQFFDFKDKRAVEEKYKVLETPIRIVKTGRSFGDDLNNFEYWVLKRAHVGKDLFYQNGDFQYKRIVKRRADGLISHHRFSSEKSLRLVPLTPKSTIKVSDVEIGIGFHWQHNEALSYSGAIELMVDNNGLLTVVNIVDLEEYLASVNSSEMRNDNNLEMLKAQTVAARGTVLATMGKHHFDEGFDLCADDHCQCYQGTARISDLSRSVTKETAGEVLVYNGQICDTRYAKICGGITEKYSACWEDLDHNYLKVFEDVEGSKNLTHQNMSEDEVVAYIDNHDYECYCNTKKYPLPESLAFCNDNFRWSVTLTQAQLQEFINVKHNLDLGDIKGFVVENRAPSGRISHLKVIGSKGEYLVKKELKIRKLFSKSHLLSSCFYINEEKNGDELIKIELVGAGWGHGVGLCQVGAQVMGEKGFGYQQILKHYYRNSNLKRIDLQDEVVKT